MDVPVTLTAGTHTISLRTSGPDGFLGGVSDCTLDRIELTEVTGPERAEYPADTARPAGGARYNPADGTMALPPTPARRSSSRRPRTAIKPSARN